MKRGEDGLHGHPLSYAHAHSLPYAHGHPLPYAHGYPLPYAHALCQFLDFRFHPLKILNDFSHQSSLNLFESLFHRLLISSFDLASPNRFNVAANFSANPSLSFASRKGRPAELEVHRLPEAYGVGCPKGQKTATGRRPPALCCGRATPETAVRPFQGLPARRAQKGMETLESPWGPLAVRPGRLRPGLRSGSSH
jgi:hypothetical protein